MAEFKKLSEVEQIESASENATVLIEEGGEIKRVAKKQVGGAGGYVIKMSEASIDDFNRYYFTYNYDEIYDILSAGGSVWIDWTDAPQISSPSNMSQGNATNWEVPKFMVVQWLLTDIGLILLDMGMLMNDADPIYFPNGSHNLEPNDK